ncbi:MAG: hypothetical protein M0C28_01580 [Candidatus Moduliflexus flocculans]|nr:hypothetical protein [Candidatus Moduliflexus flocculans]
MFALVVKSELHDPALARIGLRRFPVELPPAIPKVLQSRRARRNFLYRIRGITFKGGTAYAVGCNANEARLIGNRQAFFISNSPLDWNRLSGLSFVDDGSVLDRAEETFEGILLTGRGEFLDAIEGVGNIDIPSESIAIPKGPYISPSRSPREAIF